MRWEDSLDTNMLELERMESVLLDLLSTMEGVSVCFRVVRCHHANNAAKNLLPNFFIATFLVVKSKKSPTKRVWEGKWEISYQITSKTSR